VQPLRLARGHRGFAEAADRPPHRLLQLVRLGQLVEVGGAAQQQVPLGPRHGHVEDAPLLGLAGGLLLRLDPLELRAVHAAAADRREPQAEAAVVRDAQRAVVLAAVLAEVGHAHDRELEPLGSVHGHQPHGVERLGLERGLPLARLQHVALCQRVDERAQVAALVGLELARHPHQLAHVGHAAGAGRERQDVRVVARARDRPVDERFQRDLGRGLPLGFEQGNKGGRPAHVVGRKQLHERGFVTLRRHIGRNFTDPFAEQPPGVAARSPGLEADQRDRVQRQPGQRRGEHAVDGQLVERVRQRGEPVAQVGDLLLGPVAAAAHHVRGDPALLEGPLVVDHVGGGAQQHDHVAPLEVALAREILDAPCEQPRLCRAPWGGTAHGRAERLLGAERVVPAPLVAVGHEQLDTRVDCGPLVPRAGRLPKRLEVVPDALEGQVDRVEHLAAAAEVDRDALRPRRLRRAGPVAAEDLHVGVAEAVDRLPLVAHAEQVVAAEQLQQVVLERVGVLVLVHEHMGEAGRVLLAQPLASRQQVAGDQLEVLEVEPGAAPLALLIALPIQVEQHPQHGVVEELALGGAEGGIRGERLAICLARFRAEHLRAAGEGEAVEVRRLGKRRACGLGGAGSGEPTEQPETPLDRLYCRSCGRGDRHAAELGQGDLGGGRKRGRLGGDAWRLCLRQAGKALPAASQARVRRAHHVAQAVGRVGGHHLEPLRVLALAHEGAQGGVEGVGGHALRLELVEHPEARVDARAQRVRAKQPRAEAVDGRDPGGLRRARLLAPAQLQEAGPHPRLHLRRRLLGEGDREDRLHRHAVVDHGAHEALDQHGGLAGAGAGPHHQRPVAPSDRPFLLGGQAHASLLQTEGYMQPPFQAQLSGLQRSSPRRIAASVSRIRPSAQSSLPRNSSGSSRSLPTKPEPSSSTSAATIPRGLGFRSPRATYTPPAARSPSSRSTTSM
jgi:hypothetical protein